MTNLEQTRDAWDQYADAYDRAITELGARVAEAALAAADVGPGTRLLDVAAGGGALSIPAARRGAEVLAVDFSGEMVARLRRRAENEGLSNIEARVMDGTALDLEDDRFDVACSQLGIMLFPDRQAGLRELARVTRPGGKGVMVTFGAPERTEFMATFMRALTQALDGFSPPASSPLFTLADPDGFEQEMLQAGFQHVQVVTQRFPFALGRTAEETWTALQASAPAVGTLLGQLSEEERATARRAFSQIIASDYDGDAERLTAEFNIAIALR